MKSVAYVTTVFPTLATFLESEVSLLIERGVTVRVLALRGVGREYQPRFAPLRAVTRAVGSPLDPRGLAALAGWLMRRPHVLVPEVLRMLWQSRGSGYALAGHLGYLPAAARVAWIVEREGIDRVHGAWAHFPASVAYLAARLTGRSFSMAGHAGSDLLRTQAFLAHKARAAEFVTCCVRGNAEMLQRLAPGARIEAIPHGTDLRRFDGAGRSRATEPLLLAIGRLAPTKGFEDAIRAVARLSGLGTAPRLTIVGEGPERARLERLAAELGVRHRVELRGTVTQEDLLPLYRAAWLLVAPSRVLGNGRQDGIPNVVVEAMAMGVPCVGTRAGGLAEAIEHGVTGVLVDPADPPGLAAAIAALIARPDELERMGQAARARARAEFDLERCFERLWRLFQSDGVGRARGAA